MFKKIATNKVFWIIIAGVVVILIGVVAGVMVSRDSKESGKPGADVGTEADNDGVKTESDKDGEDDKDKPYEGSGLEVGENDETPMESIDASGSWEDTTNDQTGSSNTDKNEKQDAPDKENPKNDEKQDVPNKEEPNGDDEPGVSNGDVLEGGSWTKPR